jgi:hypothetical protein
MAVACNVARAKRWLQWCWEQAPHVSIIAPWIPFVEMGHDANPAHRERGLRDNCAAAALCDGIIGAGGKWTSGMGRERGSVLRVCSLVAESERVLDLTPLGPKPPIDRASLRRLPEGAEALVERLRSLC